MRKSTALLYCLNGLLLAGLIPAASAQRSANQGPPTSYDEARKREIDRHQAEITRLQNEETDAQVELSSAIFRCPQSNAGNQCRNDARAEYQKKRLRIMDDINKEKGLFEKNTRILVLHWSTHKGSYAGQDGRAKLPPATIRGQPVLR